MKNRLQHCSVQNILLVSFFMNCIFFQLNAQDSYFEDIFPDPVLIKDLTKTVLAQCKQKGSPTEIYQSVELKKISSQEALKTVTDDAKTPEIVLNMNMTGCKVMAGTYQCVYRTAGSENYQANSDRLYCLKKFPKRAVTIKETDIFSIGCTGDTFPKTEKIKKLTLKHKSAIIGSIENANGKNIFNVPATQMFENVFTSSEMAKNSGAGFYVFYINLMVNCSKNTGEYMCTMEPESGDPVTKTATVSCGAAGSLPPPYTGAPVSPISLQTISVQGLPTAEPNLRHSNPEASSSGLQTRIHIVNLFFMSIVLIKMQTIE